MKMWQKLSQQVFWGSLQTTDPYELFDCLVSQTLTNQGR